MLVADHAAPDPEREDEKRASTVNLKIEETAPHPRHDAQRQQHQSQTANEPAAKHEGRLYPRLPILPHLQFAEKQMVPDLPNAAPDTSQTLPERSNINQNRKIDHKAVWRRKR